MTRTTLSRRLAADLSTLKPEFAGYSESFALVQVRRVHLAPTFMRIYQRYHLETKRSFVAFVRELDPAMPVSRAAYPQSRSYRAALYLRRLAEAPETAAGKQPRLTVTPFALLATVIRSVFVMVHPHEDAVWAAITQASGWHVRDLYRLRAAVESSHYFVLPSAPRLVSRDGIAMRA